MQWQLQFAICVTFYTQSCCWFDILQRAKNRRQKVIDKPMQYKFLFKFNGVKNVISKRQGRCCCFRTGLKIRYQKLFFFSIRTTQWPWVEWQTRKNPYVFLKMETQRNFASIFEYVNVIPLLCAQKYSPKCHRRNIENNILK